MSHSLSGSSLARTRALKPQGRVDAVSWQGVACVFLSRLGFRTLSGVGEDNL